MPAPAGPLDLRVLEPVALAATREAAIACQPFVGRGDKPAADGAATGAMRSALAEAPGVGTVVIGEGEKDGAPVLYNSERVGAGEPAFDIAVDPVECMTFCAKGLPGSLTTIAFAGGDTLLRPGLSHCMEKLVVPPEARDAIDISGSPEATPLASRWPSARRPPSVRGGGPPDGHWRHAGGWMTAYAVKALGGGMQARLARRSDVEARAIAETALDNGRVYDPDDLVGGPAFFAATGVTGGSLLRRRRDILESW